MDQGVEGVGSKLGRVAVGHPIDVASGEFFTTDIDHSVPGVVPLSFGRRFSTRFLRRPLLDKIGDAPSAWLPFGAGWRPTWFAELRATMSGFVYTRADGTEFTINDPAGASSLARAGRILAPADGLELERLDDQHVRVLGYGRSRNAFSLVFARTSISKYRLVAIERTRQARVDVVYDLHGRPSHLVQRREGRSYELVHEGDRVVEVRLHLPDRSQRTVVRYAYDARRRLVRAEDERGVIATYGYDDADRVVYDEKRGGSVYTVRYQRDGRCE